MQHGVHWKAAANLELLLGAEHPPARIIRDSTSTSTNTDGASVDARNTVSFKNTLYCNRQDAGHYGTRKRLAEYYRFMFSKIPLWKKDTEHETIKTSDSEVKKESDDEESAADYWNNWSPAYRAVGILTQTSNPSDIGEDLLLPWEFYPVTDFDADDSYVDCIMALTKETQHVNGLLHIEVEEEEQQHEMAVAGTSAKVTNVASVSSNNGRLSLYTRLVPQFSGIYPGMAIGVIADPFKRSSSGALTGLLVRQFIFPSRPLLPWSMERVLPTLSSVPSSPIPTRVHFCSGPFPRRDISSILTAVTMNALLRGADLLIIGGPLVKEFEEFEKDLMVTMQRTFDELLGTYIDIVEEILENYYAANKNPRNQHRLKVVLVAHRDDVTQMPVLPTTMYGVTDGRDVWVRSNPCRISVNGIHFGVCNEDVVGDMRNRMVERWPTESGSLRRVVEALIQSRLYAPIYELPSIKHELKHFPALYMNYIPEASNENNNNGNDDRVNHRNGNSTTGLTWDSLSSLVSKENKEADDVKMEAKRFNSEEMGGVSHPQWNAPNGNNNLDIEWMPHVMFLPSTRPRFSVVTHRSVWDAKSNTTRDESELDDVSTASGVMVVNQEIWSKRSGPRFELRVAEVTIPDSELVMRRGASEANGVACGLIHFVSNAANNLN